MSSWLTLDKIILKLHISESEILTRRVTNDIWYSNKTDKYNIDSILEQRTMTIGIDKFLKPEEKKLLIIKMESYSKLQMQIFNKLQNGETFSSTGINRVHREMGKELGLKQIYCDSAMAMATGAYNSLKTWTIKYQEKLAESIKEIEQKLLIKKQYKKGLKKSLNIKKIKLENSLKKSKKSVWFGNKNLTDKDAYRKSRLSIFASGTSGVGNYKFGIVFGENGYNLKLDNILIENIKIPSAHRDTFSLIGLNRQASRISFNKKGKLILNITYSYIKPIKLANCIRSRGTIGIDIGPKEIAVSYVKNDGNPDSYAHYNIGGLQDARKEEKKRLISEILEKILEEGISQGFTHVTIENLDSLKFKKTKNKTLNRMLSKFPKIIFEDLIISKCARKGLKLKQVNPAYTSIIGLYKYSNRDNLSTAHTSNSKDLSAALAIGRRGLGLKEREVVCFRKFGRTVSFTSFSLFPAAEHVGNKGRGMSSRSNFWHKIGLILNQTQTGILREKKKNLLDSSPARLAEILETRANNSRISVVLLSNFDNNPENILPF